MTIPSAVSHLKGIFSSEWLAGWPNRLTLARVLVIPIILLIYPLNFTFTNFFCALLFGAAAATDYLDGFLARKLNQVTTIGALLDPIADKMLSASALVLLAYAQQIPPIVAGFLLCRDVLVSGIRLVAQQQNIKLEVNQLGKVKTAVADVGMGFLFIRQEEWLGLPAHAIGMLCMWAALAFSLYSGFLYLQTFFEKTNISAQSGR